MDSFEIRPATVEDVPVILDLIRALAVYEKMADQVVATEEKLRRWLFGERPAAEVLLAYAGGKPVGYALFFTNFSTFNGEPGIYLEDLFVVPEQRGGGLGRSFLSRLAEIAVSRGYKRLEWLVLDWNEPAIGFYKKLGARPMDGWTVFRMTGDSLTNLAEEGKKR